MEDAQRADELQDVILTQEIPGLTENIEALGADVEEAHGLAVKEATAAFTEDPQVVTIHTAIIPRLRAAVREHDEAINRSQAQLDAGFMGEEGHKAVVAEAKERLEAAFLKERNTVKDAGALLARKYGQKTAAPASPELMTEVQTGFAAFEAKTGRQILQEAETALRRARDESVSGAERQRQNQLLERLHLPLAQRMATQPPRHARPLQKVFERLQGAIEMHLDGVNREPYHRLARGYTSQALAGFDFIVGTVRQTGSWDEFIFSTGAPAFDWKGGSEK